jgi:selenide,water dikinase
LAVNGIVSINNLKKNNTAQEGDMLFLTKPIGVGILSTAQKRNVLKEGHLNDLIEQLTSLNSIGEVLGKIKGVSAMTDVTGFGLAGHLIEMAEGSGLSTELYYSNLIITEGAKEYLAQRIVPDATYRNWNSYSKKIGFDKDVNVMEAFSILPDPQTNGGLLIAVDPSSVNEVREIFQENQLAKFLVPIGKFVARNEKIIQVRKYGFSRGNYDAPSLQ